MTGAVDIKVAGEILDSSVEIGSTFNSKFRTIAMVKDQFDVELALRPLNILSKVLGLAHFSVYRNVFSGEVKLGDKCDSRFRNVIWCVVMMCVILTGFIINTMSVHLSSPSSIFEIVAFIISMPIAYLETLLALFAGISFSRNKFSEFVLNISEIDKYLYGYKREQIYNKQYTSYIRQLAVFPLILVPFYFYDSYIFGGEVKHLYGYMHLTSFINQVVIVQFVNVVWIIKDRLQYMKKELAKTLEMPTDISKNTQMFLNATCTDIPKRRRQMPPIRNVKYEDTGALVSHRVFRTRYFSTSEVERLIRLRELYNMIFHASSLINDIYGIHILFKLTYDFINVVLSFYGIIGIISGSLKFNSALPLLYYVVVYICWILVSLVNVFAISVSCHKATAEVESCSRVIQKLLIREPLRQDTRRQLKLLSHQMSNVRIVFTAFDLFTINMSILFTFISSATTYVIVLVQLK